MDSLFEKLPEDLSKTDLEKLQELLAEHESAIELIQKDDPEFLKDMSADEVIAELKAGVEQVKTLREEIKAHEEAHENYLKEKEAALEALKMEDEDSGDEDDSSDEEEAEAVTEAEEITAEAAEEEVAEEEKELVLASADPPVVRMSRTPPPARTDRVPTPVSEVAETGTSLVASSQFKADNPGALDQDTLAHLMRDVASDMGAVAHDGKLVQRMKVEPWQVDHYADGRRVEHGGGELVWDGPKTKVARADFEFPEERTFNGNDDYDKIRAVLPENVEFMGKPGGHGGEALVASGGLCAPLTPLYNMPNFATEAEPVWDSLPVFRAARGGVNVPTPTYIANITSAISSISEANDALGGTFATKSCQDLECPAYTETAVNIFAHCREYGNLNARAWPEKIAHENALTMAALARVSETFMLDRIKALSVNVTNGAETLGALIYLVDAIVKARFGIIGRLRMPKDTRFRALIPYWVPPMLALDTIQTPFDRFRSEESLVAYLRSLNIEPVFYLDSPSTGTTQLPDASQTAAAIDSLPDNVQWAIFPEGAFIGIDMGVLELGIVRDSTLNSTNDFQVFGERFRNLALIAPQQATYWVTSDLCASGQFPPTGTVRTCD